MNEDKVIDIERGGRVFALAGNPNVGKSTVFNNLTGLRQHTGNWTGKTVANAWGRCKKYCPSATLVDLPGCYSLFAVSEEEAIAGDYIAFGGADATVVIADATNLERNLILLLQTLEISPRVVLGVNLLDEAKRRSITVDIDKLSSLLGIEVVGIVAKNGSGLKELIDGAQRAASKTTALRLTYGEQTESAVSVVIASLRECDICRESERFMALRLLQSDKEGAARLIEDFCSNKDDIMAALDEAHNIAGIEVIRDDVTRTVAEKASEIASECVVNSDHRKATLTDRILTGKFTAFPIMLLLLAAVFWITVKGANYPSELLSKAFFALEDIMLESCAEWGVPSWLSGALILGVYRTLAWVVAVMLPPMAIFFPLFTLLEDLGYLPRVAFNLDRAFCKCNACGKQSLTMCMGLGCNAVGVTGCRIIDSPRERLIAILTNGFIPCNGRFPLILTLTAVFASAVGGLAAPFVLCAVIVIGVSATLGASYLLSKTLLKGQPSSFVLEIPPLRKPQIVKTLVRSVFDRTLHVLGRAVTVAAPAGLIIYILANTGALSAICGFLDPFARILGLDGVILAAFILGMPANEIVLPIMIMGYSSGGYLVEIAGDAALKGLLTANGWSAVTAVCVVLFSLMHSPCSTTLLTVWKETKSIKWTVVSALLPTMFGIISCAAVNALCNLLL